MKLFIKYSLLLCLAFGILLSGCYSYSPMPEVINSSNFSKLTRKQHRTLPEDCKTLSLELAEEIALANNPDYISTRHSIAAAWARFYQACAAYFPTVTASYDITEYMYTPVSSGGTGNKSIYDKKAGGLQGSWLIFDGLVRTMDMLAAKHEAKEKEALNRDSRRILIETISKSYNEILLYREKIRIAKADEEFNQKLLTETELKYEAGAVALSESLNFKIKVNSAKSLVITAQYNYATARYILAELMGLTESAIPEDVEFSPISSKNEIFTMDVEIYLDTALNNRPDIQAYREALTKAYYENLSKWGNFSPTVAAEADWGYGKTDAGYSGRYHFRSHSSDRSFNYGLEASWLLFDGGKRLAELRETQAVVAQREQELTEKWIKVVSEVRQAYENRSQAVTQVSLFESNLELVRKTRDLVEEEYKAGSTSLTRLNEAQRDLVEAETKLAEAHISLENAKAQLEASTGSR